MPRLTLNFPVNTVTLSHAQVVDLLEKIYRTQNPGKDYHVIYGDYDDYDVYKSFDETCSGVAKQINLDVYADMVGINPYIDLVVGAPWITDSQLQPYYATVVSYAKGIYDGNPLMYTSSPAAANRLKNCLAQMVKSVQ